MGKSKEWDREKKKSERAREEEEQRTRRERKKASEKSERRRALWNDSFLKYIYDSESDENYSTDQYDLAIDGDPPESEQRPHPRSGAMVYYHATRQDPRNMTTNSTVTEDMYPEPPPMRAPTPPPTADPEMDYFSSPPETEDTNLNSPPNNANVANPLVPTVVEDSPRHREPSRQLSDPNAAAYFASGPQRHAGISEMPSGPISISYPMPTIAETMNPSPPFTMYGQPVPVQIDVRDHRHNSVYRNTNSNPEYTRHHDSDNNHHSSTTRRRREHPVMSEPRKHSESRSREERSAGTASRESNHTRHRTEPRGR